MDTSTRETANTENDISREILIKSIENRLDSYKKNPAHLDFDKQQKLISDMRGAGFSSDNIQNYEKELNYIRKELSHKAKFVQRYTQKINAGTLEDDELYEGLIPTMREYMTALKYSPKKIDKIVWELASKHAGAVTSARLLKESKEKYLATDTSYNNSNLIHKCPKCSSSNISVEKKGYSLGKAAVGGLLLGAVGLLGGLIGKNKPINWCSNCGHRW